MSFTLNVKKLEATIETDAQWAFVHIVGISAEKSILANIRTEALLYIATHKDAVEADAVAHLVSLGDKIISEGTAHLGTFGPAVATILELSLSDQITALVNGLYVAGTHQLLGGTAPISNPTPASA